MASVQAVSFYRNFYRILRSSDLRLSVQEFWRSRLKQAIRENAEVDGKKLSEVKMEQVEKSLDLFRAGDHSAGWKKKMLNGLQRMYVSAWHPRIHREAVVKKMKEKEAMMKAESQAIIHEKMKEVEEKLGVSLHPLFFAAASTRRPAQVKKGRLINID
uniref:Uncharacterized protein n=1 Tax=Palpitomonas bilix TaxID=652834 RepID=A0A7S3GJ76_9EUKA